METSISFDSNKYYQIALGLSFLEHYNIEKPIIIPAEQLLTICAIAWNVDESILTGKIRHTKYKEWVRQATLMWAISYYSDPRKETKKVISCRYSSVCQASDIINKRIKDDEQIKIVISKIIKDCEVISKGIGRNCVNAIDPRKIATMHKVGYVGDNGLLEKLNLYQANKVPIRSIEWFQNLKGDQILYVYHISKPVSISLKSYTAEQNAWLLASQINGYRYTTIKEYDSFRQLNPICDKCFSKNNCGFRSIGYFSSADRINYSCFTEMEDTELKVAIDLLQPLKQYQLQ